MTHTSKRKHLPADKKKRMAERVESEYGYSLSDVVGLHHNASVCYWQQPYIDSKTGEEFLCKEISLDDKLNYITLTCKEAFFLLQWLKQEEDELIRVVREEEGIDLSLLQSVTA